MTCDLVVAGGTVVTATDAVLADVGVIDGKIAAIGPELEGYARVDASGCWVIPGAVDVHVHLATAPSGPSDAFVDDVVWGTKAAAAGGVTTVAHMAFPITEDETMAQATARDMPRMADAVTDYFVHPSFEEPDSDTLSDIAALAAAGHRSIKTVTVGLAAMGVDMIDAIAAAGSADMLTMIHCEDGPLIDAAVRQLRAAGRADVAHYALSRPDISEVAAVQRAIAIAELTGAPIYLVHVSSARALDAARRAQQSGLKVFVETRPVYLELTAAAFSEPDGGKYVGMPPLRTQSDIDALWVGLRDGAVNTVASDHAPWRLAAKTAPGLDVVSVPKGIAELETMVPLLYSSGVVAGRISLQRWVAVTATNPARLFGLFPRKGTIAVGSDADLVVFDPAAQRTIDGSTMYSRAGYSVYDGRRTSGWPRYVIGRGEILADQTRVRARPGRGRYIPQQSILPPI